MPLRYGLGFSSGAAGFVRGEKKRQAELVMRYAETGVSRNQLPALAVVKSTR